MGERITLLDMTVQEYLQLYHVSFDELDDWHRQRRLGDLARRGIREIIPAAEVFDAFRAHMVKSPLIRKQHEKVFRPETVSTYIYILNQFQAYCREMKPNMEAYEVIDHVIPFLNCIKPQKCLSDATLNKYISALRTFARHVAGKYKMDLTALPAYMEVKTGLPKALTEHQIQMLLSASDKQYYAHRYEFMVEFLLYTGLRRNEFLQVRLGDLDFERKTLFVKHGKGGASRIVPMPSEFLTQLKFYFKQMGIRHTEDYIFGNHREPSQPLSKQRIHQMFDSLVQQVLKQDPSGVSEGIHLHSLRHTSATYLYQKGVSLKEISSFLGHRDIATTEIYTQLDVEGLRKVAHPAFQYLQQIIEGSYRG